jgi:excinuclease ABC subunit A
MEIRVRGAAEHNLKNVDVDIGEGLTVVTGVSGSGKTSLVFDTIYHEARRRFLDVFSSGSKAVRLTPANVQSITGIGPTIAVGQNLLNRNPLSTLATSCGIHPFLRLLYARFGVRHCPKCGNGLSVLTEDEIVDRILSLRGQGTVKVYALLVGRVIGSHRTLLGILDRQLGASRVLVDGDPYDGKRLNPSKEHTIEVEVGRVEHADKSSHARRIVQESAALGASVLVARHGRLTVSLSRTAVCSECGTRFEDIEPVHFHTPCPYCKGSGCQQCFDTGLHPQAASVKWQDLRITEFLALTVDEAQALFRTAVMPPVSSRVRSEIQKRLDSLAGVGLGYVQLNRPSPTLSRGESQRVRLAVSLTSRLEDVVHVLDEPTIGQHAKDASKLLLRFRELPGPVIYVEHDRAAAAFADRAVDVGPGAGDAGGEIVFRGTPAELWKSETATGRYFSQRDRVNAPAPRPRPDRFITICGASAHNLQDIDVSIPVGRFTVISGISGSGKSTLVEDVLVPSLSKRKPVGCRTIDGSGMKPVLVDQGPIGRNPRSNPATYTKLSDIVRDLFARQTKLSASHFSFNRPEGACPTCRGMGAVEVKMHYLPSSWIPCADCSGQRFSDQVLSARVDFHGKSYSIADMYQLSISQAYSLLVDDERLRNGTRDSARSMLDALVTIGLGYLTIGQPSPSLSGGESQRVKLAKFLGRSNLSNRLIILDEPSTGLHPKDLAGLLSVLDRLVCVGATVVVVEHNLDIIRAADWVIDLGPGAGPSGGRVIYAGPPDGLAQDEESVTGQAINEDAHVRPRAKRTTMRKRSDCISIRNARANNLKGVDIDFIKGALTVVTGVSGSGKSSLIHDVLESEAKRRFLETLSLYERQGIHEGPEFPVDSVSGLGVSVSIIPGQSLYSRRSTVGTVTEISHHLAALLAAIGKRTCLQCGAQMKRNQQWMCPNCGATAPLAEPRHFSSSTYSSACPGCHGVGTLQVPAPEKLIINPDKPICSGAMYSPGFFPKGFLCKPYNGGFYIVQAVGRRYGFDPKTTPWKNISPEGQRSFLFGETEPMEVEFESPRRPPYVRRVQFRGFYGWIGEWDVGGTYTTTKSCDQCKGTGFRPEYLAVKLAGHDVYQLSQMPLIQLTGVLGQLVGRGSGFQPAKSSLETVLRRLGFLTKVGLGYLHLNRVTATLSAGEAQRVRLSGLLGSRLTSLTVILDEPTRGMHPSEVESLVDALRELRDEGNTVLVVEHDPLLIRAADQLVEMGPGAGVAGGQVVASGSLKRLARSDTATGRWLRGEGKASVVKPRREPKSWLTVRGAKENNLRGEDIHIPLGVLVGVCGVSGSGKSTLIVDTIGRALAPKEYTTSVASQPIEPGLHDSIEGAPARTVVLDQTREHIRSPGQYLRLFDPLLSLYAQSEDAVALGVSEVSLSKPCEVCDGRGSVRTDMGFLPDMYTPCETCRGTGRSRESWDVRLKGISFAEVGNLTMDELYDLFDQNETLARRIRAARDVGLGYLVLRQSGYALSGGESQRLKIAGELSEKSNGETLYILDEPTVGQHMEDVNRLIGVLHRLVDEGQSVIVVEHHPNLLTACDWLVELGPGAGPDGGKVIASGPPEEVARGETPTARYIKDVLEGTP